MLDIKQQNSATSNVNNKPNVGLMPNFPKKQGKMFRVALGQDVSNLVVANFCIL